MKIPEKFQKTDPHKHLLELHVVLYFFSGAFLEFLRESAL